VAFSGSLLAVDWAPGSKNLALLVTRVHQAVAWARSNGWNPVIDGSYWMQGERDATDASYAASYRKHLLQFIKQIRRQLPLKSTKPFAIGQIDLADFIYFEVVHQLCSTKGCAGEKLWNAEVTKAQASVEGRYVLLAKTSKLPRYQGYLHLTDACGARTWQGVRHIESYQDLAVIRSHLGGPPPRQATSSRESKL